VLICYGDEGTPSSVSRVDGRAIIRKLLDLFSTHHQYLYDSERYLYAYKGLLFRKVAHTRYDVTRFVEWMDFRRCQKPWAHDIGNPFTWNKRQNIYIDYSWIMHTSNVTLFLGRVRKLPLALWLYPDLVINEYETMCVGCDTSRSISEYILLNGRMIGE
jgi:hypothetical protein